MEEMKDPLVRYNIPTRYDMAPVGTVYKVQGDSVGYDLYIQLSEAEDHANWVRMGIFLEKIMSPLLEDKSFMDHLLIAYLKKEALQKSPFIR
jgi:hypothetical protein